MKERYPQYVPLIAGMIVISFVVNLLMNRVFHIGGSVNQLYSSSTGTSQAIHYELSSFQKALIETVKQAKENVVSIVISKDLVLLRNPFFGGLQGQADIRTQKTQIGGGSGIFVHKDGYILTNKHVVEDPDAQYTVIFGDGKTASGTRVWLDPVLDIAVLKVDKIPAGDSAQPAHAVSLKDEVSIGQFVIAIGNALAEYQNSVTFGIISGRNRTLGMQSENLYAGLYQTDTSINRGNSGGPLLDINGKVIGINTAISAEGSNISFSIPVTQEFIDATLESIEKNNKIMRPFVGVQYVDLNVQQAQQLGISQTQGVYVADVIAGSAGDTAGIKKGDIITAIDGKPINDEYPFLYQLYTFVPGEEVKMTVLRDSMPRDIKIVLGSNEAK